MGSASRLWGPVRPACFTARFEDDREIVAVCQRTTPACQKSGGSGRHLWEKETSIVSGDGRIRHSCLLVNIYDVIFSLKGRLCLCASAIAATVVSVCSTLSRITEVFFFFVLDSFSDLMRNRNASYVFVTVLPGEVIKFQVKTGI